MNRLAQLLKQPEFEWLLDRLAQRIERGQPIDRGTVSLRAASPDQRRAVDDLMGRRSTTGNALTVDLERLGHRLDANLGELVTTVRGPLRNRRAERDAHDAAWDAVIDEWIGCVGATAGATAWIDGLARHGILKRLCGGDIDRARDLMRDAWRVLSGAPHEGVLLATLAAQVTGDSHALDRGRPLGTLCLSGVRALHGIDGQRDGTARREAWDAIGVTVDDLSAPVLCLNLPVDADCELRPWVQWHVQRGEPYYLSWRMVQRFTPSWRTTRVFVCENPAIVSEATSRLGAAAHPVICTHGVPVSAVTALISKLSTPGIDLHLRADFDWTGLRIVDRLLTLSGGRPWRMTSSDYAACSPSSPLKGAAPEFSWAKDLIASMTSTGRAGYEEELIENLLRDLQD